MKNKESAALKNATPDTTENAQSLGKPSSNRTPWLGALSEEEMSKPGGVLLSMLIARAKELRQNLGEMAAELNVSYGYISQLRSGLRKVNNISDEFATACAVYLQVPRLTVLTAAGQVRPTDIYEKPNDLKGNVTRAIQFMQGDSHYGAMMPPEIMNLSLEAQFLIVQLYEGATQRKLIPGDFDAESMAREMEAYRAYSAKLQKEVDDARERKGIESEARQGQLETDNA